VESRNVTWTGPRFPVFWEAAHGANVQDVDGNVYVDLTAAFGVALAGHAHPRIQEAVKEQAGRLIHGMGDVHPPAIKVALLERLAALSPWAETRGVLASAGSEAVEIALKTAMLHTGRAGILAFEGAYHGLTLGALATTERGYFRSPFADRLFGGVAFAPFPDPRDGSGAIAEALDAVESALANGAPTGEPIGAVIVEPVQGRAGVRLPPDGFLAGVSERARAAGAAIIADEVFTGAGRCGAFLISQRYGLEPDLVCLGKAIGGGLPLSVCLGRADVMDAWPPSPGEALHTSTYLGHPLGCAAALALLDLFEEGVGARARTLGDVLLQHLRVALDGTTGVGEVRGAGLLLGIELSDEDGSPAAPTPRKGERVKALAAPGVHRRGASTAHTRIARGGAAARVAHAALAEGFLVLPAGAHGHVVELSPPACLTDEQVEAAVASLARVVRRVLVELP
jgi:4-aminobutyrate aminotransferase/(S)-3-amino-2-methylpropionate transaminase